MESSLRDRKEEADGPPKKTGFGDRRSFEGPDVTTIHRTAELHRGDLSLRGLVAGSKVERSAEA